RTCSAILQPCFAATLSGVLTLCSRCQAAQHEKDLDKAHTGDMFAAHAFVSANNASASANQANAGSASSNAGGSPPGSAGSASNSDAKLLSEVTARDIVLPTTLQHPPAAHQPSTLSMLLRTTSFGSTRLGVGGAAGGAGAAGPGHARHPSV